MCWAGEGGSLSCGVADIGAKTKPELTFRGFILIGFHCDVSLARKVWFSTFFI